jgi:hypothetical protein
VDGDVRAGWFFGFVDDLASWSCFGFLHNLDRFPMVVSREAAGTLGIKGGDSDNGEGSVLVRALSFKKDGDATTINVNIYRTSSAHAFDRGAKDQLPLDLAWPLKLKRGIDGIVVTSAQEPKWSLTRYHAGLGDSGRTREWSTFLSVSTHLLFRLQMNHHGCIDPFMSGCWVIVLVSSCSHESK